MLIGLDWTNHVRGESEINAGTAICRTSQMPHISVTFPRQHKSARRSREGVESEVATTATVQYISITASSPLAVAVKCERRAISRLYCGDVTRLPVVYCYLLRTSPPLMSRLPIVTSLDTVPRQQQDRLSQLSIRHK
ncbi:hypothetical protein J6590_022563 [Homalodisca vitripennis]|nr:hypothetical protein J6590_022563 [Homalodisca vitripennis]